jgi:hypothetical protein
VRTVKLSTLAKGKALTLREVQQVQEWLDADWESHDALDRDARKLMQRLLTTVREGVRRTEHDMMTLTRGVIDLLFDSPMRVSELYRRLGGCDTESMKRKVDDVVWELVQDGKVRIENDSTMRWVR